MSLQPFAGFDIAVSAAADPLCCVRDLRATARSFGVVHTSGHVV